jgi:EpsI family protein
MSTALVLALSSVWPVWAAYIDYRIAHQFTSISLIESKPILPWRKSEAITNWQPNFLGADARYQAFYTDGRYNIAVFLYYYQIQEQGKELISSRNTLVGDTSYGWKNIKENPFEAKLFGRDLDVIEERLRSPQQDLLTWRWYWISGYSTSNSYTAKLRVIYRVKLRLL